MKATDRRQDLEQMLEDIEAEVKYTAGLIGRDHLARQVMDAMERVPRHLFVPADMRGAAYANGPLPIGHGQTISQPYIVALMTDLAALTPGSRVLEIGTGSGYQTAILAELGAEVYSTEIVSSLQSGASERLAELGYTNVHTRVADGYHGWPEHAPYDAILVTAAAPVVPQPLIDQLRPGGRLVIPVGEPYGPQQLMLVEKDEDGELKITDVLAVAFVPLTGSH